jgi:hypothetical protein
MQWLNGETPSAYLYDTVKGMKVQKHPIWARATSHEELLYQRRAQL